MDANARYMLVFVKEALKFQLFSFLKRVQIISKINNKMKEIHNGLISDKGG